MYSGQGVYTIQFLCSHVDGKGKTGEENRIETGFQCLLDWILPKVNIVLYSPRSGWSFYIDLNDSISTTLYARSRQNRSKILQFSNVSGFPGVLSGVQHNFMLMNQLYTTMTNPFYAFTKTIQACLLVVIMASPAIALSQLSIEWQRNYGTSTTDNANQVFPDEKGNVIIIGRETHADFAGNFRPYMMVAKIDPSGNEIWKKYHDVAFNTFNPPLDYGIGKHFYTEEFGDTLLNLVIHINQQVLQYKILDKTGDYYFYEQALSSVLDVDRENEKVYANVLCSIQQSCYGPDSLVVEKFDPSPDSIIFNPIEWTYAIKQNFRTTPIQGHYDFDVQDIRMDSAGFVYLLVQIERWDFQFCTDCGDAFIDAWSEVFKFDNEGNLLKHVNLKTVRAVVSGMRFVRMHEDGMIIQINDINAGGTKMLTTLYRLDDDLNLQKKIEMSEAYNLVEADEQHNIYTARNIFDEQDPEIKGLSDVLVTAFDADGVELWEEYYGGSSWDFPHSLTLGQDGALYFLANTESSDFDVAENFGGQDIWLVKLSENGATGISDPASATALTIFPNPSSDNIRIETDEILQVTIYDVMGKPVITREVSPSENIDITVLPAGLYTVRSIYDAQQEFVARLVKH
jgi:hypothetical protein